MRFELVDQTERFVRGFPYEFHVATARDADPYFGPIAPGVLDWCRDQMGEPAEMDWDAIRWDTGGEGFIDYRDRPERWVVSCQNIWFRDKTDACAFRVCWG